MFRKSVADSGIDVVAFQIDACGYVEARENDHWFVAGQNRFLVVAAGEAPRGRLLCVTGWLNDLSEPDQLILTTVQPVAN